MSFPGIVALSPKDVLLQTESKRFALGTRGETPDGRKFRYSKAGEALSVGILCQAAAALGDFDTNDTSCKLVTSITTYSTTANYLRISTTWATPGGSTGFTKDLFKDGYVWIDGSTGGQMLRIKGNTTGSSGTASQYTDIQFRDGERLSGAIDTSTLLVLRRNPYDSVIEYDGLATMTGHAVGVAPRDVTNAYYFWLQTGGPCPVMSDGTLILGEAASATTNTGIQGVQAYGSTQEADRRPSVGTVIVATADTRYALLDLKLD